ncbi:MAG TPA: hypothetical protein VLF18_17320 [Tahibacter sp.]|uniref:hypothetical protein n=1 Tax=Tahibacter sp. TaxID=2056211 RepID=UPI002C5DA2E7|nr:hypothetical protein [Tahibacter sp.]HSX61951.1 hypothetical protein [Tahibacter sp.]
MTLRLLLSACLLAACAGACAHGPAPAERWCSVGVPMNVASFGYSQTDIYDYHSCLETGVNCTSAMPPEAGCTLATCGEFDDDYGKANRLAYNYCATFETSTSPGGIGSTRAHVQSPQTYLDPSHHSAYQALSGLYGVCQRCVAASNTVGR